MNLKKNIKIKVISDSLNNNTFDIYKFIPKLNKEKYNIEYSANPDYLIYVPSNQSKYLDYDCIRIAIEAERYTPDFNICDYAISDDYMVFGDRHYRLPYLAYSFMREAMEQLAVREKKILTYDDLKEKDMFCNFMYSNDRADGYRGRIFRELSEYKMVHSGGALYNNIGYRVKGGVGDYDEKIKFQKRSKFTLAIENVKNPGHTTEKILHGFIAETIPIYWGNPNIDEIFNPASFININDFDSMENVLDYIKMIDNDDDKYIAMLNQPILNPNFSVELFDQGQANFIEHIFDQEYLRAGRRTKVLHTVYHEADFKRGRRYREMKKNIRKTIVYRMRRFGFKNINRNSVLFKLYRKIFDGELSYAYKKRWK